MEKDVSDYFYGVKEEVSADYKDLAFFLGIPDTRNIESKSTNPDAKSCCMDVLQTWKRENGDQATVEVLLQALVSAGLQSAADNLRRKHGESIYTTATSDQHNVVDVSEMAENPITSSECGGISCRIRNFFHFSCLCYSKRVWCGLVSTICVCVFLYLTLYTLHSHSPLPSASSPDLASLRPLNIAVACPPPTVHSSLASTFQASTWLSSPASSRPSSPASTWPYGSRRRRN